jgi:hypothetical protein
MKKRLILLVAVPFVFAALVPGCAMYARNSARLNLSDMDDLLTAEKWIGLVPASKEIHAEGVGFLDQTIYYDATVTPSELLGWTRSLRSHHSLRLEAAHFGGDWVFGGMLGRAT